MGDGALLADPEAAVDAASQMLGKVSVYVPANRAFAGVGVDNELIHRFLRREQLRTSVK